MNISDSERIAGFLEKQGYKRTEKRQKADLVIMTTCGVRQKAEDRIYGLIPRIKKDNPAAKIILTGCLVNRLDVRKRLGEYVDLWMPINKIKNYKYQISNKLQISNFKTKNKLKFDNCGYLNIKPKYVSRFSALVPIGNGCNNFCSYCVVPYARGRETCRPAEEVIKEVKYLVKNGYKEIILIAQNVNSYKYNQNAANSARITGIKKNWDFSMLLKALNAIPGNFWIRFLTSHPRDMSAELIKTVADCEKVCRHIHLPAQSGDNKILKKMNRKYTREHYFNLIKKIRKVMPDASVTTDIIVGFPGETKKQFANTLKLFKEARFDMAYISQYSPRFGTAAFKMDDSVPLGEKKKREKELDKVLKKSALENNKKYLGETEEVLFENKKGDRYFGKTKIGKKVEIIIKKGKYKIGDFAPVKILKAKEFGMKGKIVAR